MSSERDTCRRRAATPRARGAHKRTVLHERIRKGSVGNWVASGANFLTPLLPVGVIPTMSRESRRAVCAEKWPEAQADRVAGVHVFSPQGQKPSPATG